MIQTDPMKDAWSALNGLENLSCDIYFDVITHEEIAAICDKAAKHLRAALTVPESREMMACDLVLFDDAPHFFTSLVMLEIYEEDGQ